MYIPSSNGTQPRGTTFLGATPQPRRAQMLFGNAAAMAIPAPSATRPAKKVPRLWLHLPKVGGELGRALGILWHEVRHSEYREAVKLLAKYNLLPNVAMFGKAIPYGNVAAAVISPNIQRQVDQAKARLTHLRNEAAVNGKKSLFLNIYGIGEEFEKASNRKLSQADAADALANIRQLYNESIEMLFPNHNGKPSLLRSKLSVNSNGRIAYLIERGFYTNRSKSVRFCRWLSNIGGGKSSRIGSLVFGIPRFAGKFGMWVSWGLQMLRPLINVLLRRSVQTAIHRI